MEFSKVIGLDEKFSVVWKTQAKHSRMFEDVFGHSAGIFADKADGMGDLVKAFANGVKVAKRHQFTLVENDDLFGDTFDFPEDVAADEDGSSQLNSRITFMMVVRARGSQPWSGSSRMMSSGSFTNA